VSQLGDHAARSPVDRPVLEKAQDLIQSSGVKTLDAIHIASALLFQADFGARIPFISADEQQLNAASACGLQMSAGRVGMNCKLIITRRGG
jgi:hypothetical protein